MNGLRNINEVTGEPGNLVFRTQNSAYEVDQEQKVFRRLAGNLPPGGDLPPDGDWVAYDSIGPVVVDQCVYLTLPDHPHRLRTSRVTSVEGTFVEPPCTRMSTPLPSEPS